jgi:hypothetical protein
MVNSFEGLAQRIRDLWMAVLGSRLGRCDSLTTADSEGGSGEVKMPRGPLTRTTTRAGIAGGRKIGDR